MNKTALVKHSVRIAGHATSVSLEPAFWQALCDIAARRGIPVNALLTEIDAARGGNLSSAVRLFVLECCRRGELTPRPRVVIYTSIADPPGRRTGRSNPALRDRRARPIPGMRRRAQFVELLGRRALRDLALGAHRAFTALSDTRIRRGSRTRGEHRSFQRVFSG